MKALVIGGTGPTGPHLIAGLITRGYEVSMLNRGSRDSDAIPAQVERLVGDPHFPDTLEQVLRGRTFDLVIATYGRLRHVAEVVSSMTDRLVTVGGAPGYRGFADPKGLFPRGMPIPTQETAPMVESEEENRFGHLIRITEDAIMEQHRCGAVNVTHFRYPTVYGPWQVRATNLWWVIQRCLDQRPCALLPEGGLSLITRGYSENIAHSVLLAVDQPGVSAGQIYNCGDELQFSLAQWVEIIAAEMDWPLEILSVPDAVASPSRELMQFSGTSHHQYLDLYKIRHQLGYTDQVDPLTAVRRTMRWMLDNPPTDTAYIEGLRAHYALEDRLAEVCRNAREQMAAFPHPRSEFHHSYAHPRKRGLTRDHRGR